MLIEKLRNTIKVCCDGLGSFSCSCRPCKNGWVNITCAMQEFELTIDLDVMLAELDKEQSGSIDYKEFKSLLD